MNIELEENKNEINENINMDNKISTNNELNVEEESFFNTTFGKIVESGIEIGIKAIFPSFIEDEIINKMWEKVLKVLLQVNLKI